MLVSSLLIGLAGGVHCGLMCGPLHAAVFRNQKLNYTAVLYQFGRILMYIMIGLLFLGLGESASFLGLQNLFIYFISAYIIYFYILPKKWKKLKWLYKAETLPFKLFGKVLKKGKGLNKKLVRFLTGMLNGLLPCGLVYMAAANALLAPSIFMNILSMAIFGLATVPWLVGSTVIIKFPVNFLKFNTNKLRPYLATAVVLILLLRVIDVPTMLLEKDDTTANKTITSCGGINQLY